MDRIEQMAGDILNGESYVMVAGRMLTRGALVSWLKQQCGTVPPEPLAPEPVQYLPVRKPFNWGGDQWYVGKLERGTVTLMVTFPPEETSETKARELALQPGEVERQATIRNKALSHATSSKGPPLKADESRRTRIEDERVRPAAKPGITDHAGEMKRVIDNAQGKD